MGPILTTAARETMQVSAAINIIGFAIQIKPFPSQSSQNCPLGILLYLTPDDFGRQGRAFGWERVNWVYLP